MSVKTLGLDDALHRYVVAHSRPDDAVLASVAAETRRRWPERVGLAIAPEQGAFMELLARLTGASVAVEIGTFTGYSSICLARGLAEDGHLHCFDASAEWTAVAREHWERAGLDQRITLHLGDAHEQLPAALATLAAPVDLAFIDADKPGYPAYYEQLLAHLAPDGVIAVDNTLSGGRVVDPGDSDDARAIAAFNQQVVEDPRVEVVLLPVADGLSLISPVSGARDQR